VIPAMFVVFQIVEEKIRKPHKREVSESDATF
jgi:hypothetical protein